MIVGVAVKIEDITIALPKPNRHSDCIAILQSISLDRSVENNWGRSSNQGFIDEFGKYYTRPEASKHAFDCGQIEKDRGAITSEDLW